MLTSKTAKEFAASASTCESSIEAKELFNTGMVELEKIFESSVSCLYFLYIFLHVTYTIVIYVYCCAPYTSYTTYAIHHTYTNLHIYRRKSKHWTI